MEKKKWHRVYLFILSSKYINRNYCGKTVEMPSMYSKDKYDLAGFAVGIVERKELLPKELSVGDVVFGLASSGIHSNGFSLIRYLIEKNHLSYEMKAPFNPKISLYESLLTPTRIYVKSCLKIIQEGGVKAIAHITGGGLKENIPRIIINSSVAVEIDLSTWNLPPIFQWLKNLGNIETEEFIKTFNCGIGMILIISIEKADIIENLLKDSGEIIYKIGKVIERENENIPIIFKNNWK